MSPELPLGEETAAPVPKCETTVQSLCLLTDLQVPGHQPAQHALPCAGLRFSVRGTIAGLRPLHRFLQRPCNGLVPQEGGRVLLLFMQSYQQGGQRLGGCAACWPGEAAWAAARGSWSWVAAEGRGQVLPHPLRPDELMLDTSPLTGVTQRDLDPRDEQCCAAPGHCHLAQGGREGREEAASRRKPMGPTFFCCSRAPCGSVK